MSTESRSPEIAISDSFQISKSLDSHLNFIFDTKIQSIKRISGISDQHELQVSYILDGSGFHRNMFNIKHFTPGQLFKTFKHHRRDIIQQQIIKIEQINPLSITYSTLTTTEAVEYFLSH